MKKRFMLTVDQVTTLLSLFCVAKLGKTMVRSFRPFLQLEWKCSVHLYDLSI